MKMTFTEIRIIATGPCIANQLRDVNTTCRRSWYIAAHVWKIYGMIVTRSLVLYACFVDRCLSFCTFSLGHCVVCSSSIDGFWLSLWYLQTLLPPGIWLQTADDGHNSLPFESLLVKLKKVVVLFVNIMIIGTCSLTGDMYFIHTCT
jgi:hypothetical protein